MKSWLSGKAKRSAWLVLLLLMANPLVGCGGPYTGTISGQVTYKGESVPNADVFFYHTTDGRYASARTDSNGNYTCYGAPGGPVKVVVTTTEPRPIPQPGMSILGAKALTKEEYDERVRNRPAYKKIPARYGKQATTPLTYEVQRGEQSEPYNIELKDRD